MRPTKAFIALPYSAATRVLGSAVRRRRQTGTEPRVPFVLM